MKVVILAGGKGTRISQKVYSKTYDRGRKKPLIVHIMQHYAKFGFKDLLKLQDINKKL